MPRYYPAFIDIRDRACVVVGGGAFGEEKVVKLLECGASVIVISEDVAPSVADMAARGEIRWERRGYRDGDLAGAFIAIVADTSDDALNRRIADEARARNVPLNVVDVTHLCTFIAPSVARRGEVTVATSTGGASPALARTFREKIEASRILEYADLAPLLADVRAQIRREGIAVKPDDWQACISETLLDMVQSGDYAAARRALVDGLLARSQPADSQ